MDDNTYKISAGASYGPIVGADGGMGNRVNAIVFARVMQAQEAAMKQLLTSLGIGSQINVTI